jgi:hypothetical protein|uniref:Uncharacterized protein n=1 Tax=Mus musculus TaxID=10090 RepID=Q9D6G2_MOUSE|nr:unnamed protein product [Mus musculus]
MDGLQKTALVQYKGWGSSLGVGEAPSGRCAPASLLPSLFPLSLPTAMGFHNSAIEVDGREGLLYRVKPPLLMSPVFNHHTVGWFYAYFICISLNYVSEGAPRAERSTKLGRQGRKKRFPMMLIFKRGLVPSMMCLLPF